MMYEKGVLLRLLWMTTEIGALNRRVRLWKYAGMQCIDQIKSMGIEACMYHS